jgi:1-acyl-sn-glycerol-3-phosphate acyltransferase
VQNVIIDKPYRFVAPCRGGFWPRLLYLHLPRYLEKNFGLVRVDCAGVERLKSSLAAGHGILLAPNHSRPCDPQVLGMLAREARCTLFLMASWHLFMQSRAQTWLLRRAGAFSVYREGMDRAAIGEAIGILERAERPLILFPEGIVSRTNDCLSPLQEGTAFIARNAAKKRLKVSAQTKVVLHPVALNYFYQGDIRASVQPVLDEIEKRLSWRPQRHLPLVERIYKLGSALLGLKEIEYLGQPQGGEIKERLARLRDIILDPLEKEWRGGKREANIVARVKALRAAILPDMAAGEVSDEERSRRWRQLADLYLVQQLDFYRPDYVRSRPTPERILETVERFEEDLTDETRIYQPMTAHIEVGEAIEVNPERDRSAASDPVMRKLEDSLREMLQRNAEKFTKPLEPADFLFKEPAANSPGKDSP